MQYIKCTSSDARVCVCVCVLFLASNLCQTESTSNSLPSSRSRSVVLQLWILKQRTPRDGNVRVRLRLRDFERFELFQHQQRVELLGGLKRNKKVTLYLRCLGARVLEKSSNAPASCCSGASCRTGPSRRS